MSITLSVVLTMLGYVLGLALIPWIVLQRRQSGATLAWVLVLVFLPYVGAFLFLAIGAQTVRWRRRRRQRSKADVASKLTVSTQAVGAFEDLAEDPALATLSEPANDLVRLADRLALPCCGGNEVTLLVDPHLTFTAIEAAVEGARSHIHFEYYIWRPDVVGRRLRDHLVRAARRGVEVRVLVDDVGSRATGWRFWRPLLEAGGRVARFLPRNPISRWLFLNLNNRNHRKIVVVDGSLAFTGGINIGAERVRDTHLQLRGPVVTRLQEVFAEDWFNATNEDDLTAASYFPSPVPCGEERAQILASGPDDGRANAIGTVYFGALTLARKNAWLTTPYFVPDVALTAALRTAALRGVDVRILLPHTPNEPFVYHAARSFFPELLAAGVGIYEYASDDRELHAKTATVDGCWATVGSANLDNRSFRLNFEANAVVYGGKLPEELERVFQDDLACARRVELTEFEDRGRIERAFESAARVLAPLL